MHRGRGHLDHCNSATLYISDHNNSNGTVQL